MSLTSAEYAVLTWPLTTTGVYHNYCSSCWIFSDMAKMTQMQISLWIYSFHRCIIHFFSSYFIKILLLWILWNHNVHKITFGSLPLSTKSLLNVVRLHKYIWIKFTASVLLGFETHFKITFFLLQICSKSIEWLQNDHTIGQWVYLGTKSIGRI